MKSYRLYLGLNSGRTPISSVQFETFLADTVAVRFSGFTVQYVSGYYKGKQEPSAVIEVLADSATAEFKVREIAAEYARRFEQESVLLAVLETPASFLEFPKSIAAA